VNHAAIPWKNNARIVFDFNEATWWLHEEYWFLWLFFFHLRRVIDVVLSEANDFIHERILTS
jgi:hypothetical protein